MRGSNKKVLIVEDDSSLLDLYDRKFSVSGYEVIRAEDGAKGLEAAEKFAPDVILLDIMLPIMNGFEVLKRIKKNKTLSKTPIIILSNYGETRNVTDGLTGGAAEYLIKVEHTPEEVVEIVEDIFHEKQSLVGKAFKETA